MGTPPQELPCDKLVSYKGISKSFQTESLMK